MKSDRLRYLGGGLTDGAETYGAQTDARSKKAMEKPKAAKLELATRGRSKKMGKKVSASARAVYVELAMSEQI